MRALIPSASRPTRSVAAAARVPAQRDAGRFFGHRLVVLAPLNRFAGGEVLRLVLGLGVARRLLPDEFPELDRFREVAALLTAGRVPG